MQKKLSEGKTWWEMYDYCEDTFYNSILSALPKSGYDDGVVIYVFNDKSFPSAMSFLEKTG